MNKKTLLIVGAVVVVILLWLGGSYNSFVRLDQAVAGQWAQVETQYQRRFDLIPNLVESVKGIFEQEKEVFGKLADARARYSGATSVNEKVAAAGQVESALGRLLVVMENYPQLRSSESVQTLMAQLEGAENRVSVERGRFNDTVKTFNTRAKTFPSNIVARLFGFGAKNFFEAAAGAEVAPKVQF
ncbi:MAG: LemA family protein [bacterium]|nr:LemA family protein [bacterium]